MQLQSRVRTGTWLWLGWLVVAFGFGLWTGRFGLQGEGRRAGLQSASFRTPSTSPVRTPRLKAPARQHPAPQPVVCPKPQRSVRRLARIQDLPQLAWERFPMRKRRRLLALLNTLRTPCSCGQTLAQCTQIDLKQCQSLRSVLGQVMQLVYIDTPTDSIRQVIRASAAPHSTSMPVRGKSTFPLVEGQVYHLTIPKDSPGYGSSHAKLTVMIFSDFVCPECWGVMKQVHKLEANYGIKEVRVVFRHFPLRQHPRAWVAAEAAQAAHQQGKFWVFHDKLFSHPDKLEKVHLLSYAKSIGLDMTQFKKALDDGTYQSVVRRDVATGRRFRLPGIPFVFLNGLPVLRMSNMQKVAARAWRRAEALLKRGTPRYALYRTLIEYGRREP